MACENWKFKQGDDPTLNFYMVDECDETKRINLIGATALEFAFKNADNTILIKTLSSGVTLTNAGAGEGTIQLTTAETNLLKVVSAVDVEAHYVMPGSIDKYVTIEKILTVEKKLLFT
jgi:hypothetical protein